MPREYDYQDIEVRFGDLRVAAPGDLDRVPYQGQFLPPSPWMAAPDAAVHEVHVEGTISLKPEPAPEPPRPRKSFWDHILEEE